MLSNGGKREFYCTHCGSTAIEKNVLSKDERSYPWWLPRQRMKCNDCNVQLAWVDRGKGKVGDDHVAAVKLQHEINREKEQALSDEYVPLARECDTVQESYPKGEVDSDVKNAFNHRPNDYDVWIPYNGWRYKEVYDILLHNGMVVHDTYPNACSWSRDWFRCTDANVKGIMLPRTTMSVFGRGRFIEKETLDEYRDVVTETMEFNHKPFNITRHVIERKMNWMGLDHVMRNSDWGLIAKEYEYTHVRVGAISYPINEEGKLPDWSPLYARDGHKMLMDLTFSGERYKSVLADCTEEYQNTDLTESFEPTIPEGTKYVRVNGIHYHVIDGVLTGWDECVEDMVSCGLLVPKVKTNPGILKNGASLTTSVFGDVKGKRKPGEWEHLSGILGYLNNIDLEPGEWMHFALTNEQDVELNRVLETVFFDSMTGELDMTAVSRLQEDKIVDVQVKAPNVAEFIFSSGVYYAIA